MLNMDGLVSPLNPANDAFHVQDDVERGKPQMGGWFVGCSVITNGRPLLILVLRVSRPYHPRLVFVLQVVLCNLPPVLE